MLKGIIQDLRNAYEAHDRSAFEEALQRLRRLEAVVPETGCSRREACVCNKHIREVCMYRIKL